MKVKVIIEEVVTQTFEVEIDESKDVYDQVKKLYRDETLIVNNPTLIEVNANVCDKNGEETGWVKLH